MLALKITDVKDFMNKLLIGEVFDRFSLVEASVTTFNTFTINGKLHYDFFDTDTKAAFEENSTEYSLWHDVKPYCFSIIRGRRTPLNFRIVFELSHDQTQSLLKNEQHIADIPVQSLFTEYPVTRTSPFYVQQVFLILHSVRINVWNISGMIP